MPRPEVRAGERVRLHGLAVGGTEDGHALWLGGAAVRQAAAGQQAADVVVLTPGGTADADVVFRTEGGWTGGVGQGRWRRGQKGERGALRPGGTADADLCSPRRVGLWVGTRVVKSEMREQHCTASVGKRPVRRFSS